MVVDKAESSNISKIEEFLHNFVTEYEIEVSTNYKKLNFEFLEIRKEQNDLFLMEEYRCDSGQKFSHFLKNRYRDILPYDRNRVVLKSNIKNNPEGYINASHISNSSVKTKWIAAQGPLTSTLMDFWSMVFEYNIKIIVMLCNCFENDMPKCEKYWADNENSRQICDNIIVYTTEDTTFDDFIWRKLKLKRRDGENSCEKIIHHLHFTKWPDHGCPDDEKGFLEFMDLYDKLKNDFNEKEAPILVHCSAGCGRTGTAIAFDIVKQMIMANLTEELQIQSIINDLRRQRICMVQTPVQYQFLHKCIAQFCKKFLTVLQSNNLTSQSDVDDKSLITYDDETVETKNVITTTLTDTTKVTET